MVRVFGFGGLRSAIVRVEVLHFDGCPTSWAVERASCEVFAREGVQADIELVAVDTAEAAMRAFRSGVPLRPRRCSCRLRDVFRVGRTFRNSPFTHLERLS
jgi:hypothetical protein